jgi:hypothetical protein
MNVSRFESDRAISESLRRLAAETDVPDWNPSSERALLAAFDAARSRRPRRRAWIAYSAVAAAVAIAAVALTTVSKHEPNRVTTTAAVRVTQPRITPTQVVAAAATGHPAKAVPVRRASRPATVRASRTAPQFISWPGASELPAFESGELMRVDLPASMAVSLGLVRATRSAVVQADVLFGQDGFARAVRLAP